MLCQFQVYSKVVQLYIYMNIYTHTRAHTHTHTHTFTVFQILFHQRLLEDGDSSSLGYTVGPCLSLLHIVHDNPKLLIYPCSPLVPISFSIKFVNHRSLCLLKIDFNDCGGMDTTFSVTIGLVFKIFCFKMHDVLLFLRILIFIEHFCISCTVQSALMNCFIQFFYHGLMAYTRCYFSHSTAKELKSKSQSVAQEQTASTNIWQNQNLNLICMNPESSIQVQSPNS